MKTFNMGHMILFISIIVLFLLCGCTINSFTSCNERCAEVKGCQIDNRIDNNIVCYDGSNEKIITTQCYEECRGS